MTAAIEEGARLFVMNQSFTYVEAAFRMRALQEITEDLSTETLLMLVEACGHAKQAGTLKQNLKDYLAGPAEWGAKAPSTGSGAA
ncbi:MAG: hypothetical protein ABIO39_04930 [Caulobacteraceae bacterium]